jgi:predicted amidohydrolase YtcJ
MVDCGFGPGGVYSCSADNFKPEIFALQLTTQTRSLWLVCLQRRRPDFTFNAARLWSFTMRRFWPLCLLLVPAILTAPAAQPAGEKSKPSAVAAALVLLNGKIWAVNKSQPEAQALAVWQDRIIAVGSNEDIRPLIGRDTKVIDLNERRVLPGFHDSHVHLLSSGLLLSRIQLKDAKDEAEFGKRLREFDKKLPAGRWMLGGNWDHDRTFAGELPTAALLDKYVSDRPVLVHRYDHHMALANTKALKLAGVTEATPDPDGGVVYRKPGTKEPTGLLRDKAISLVASQIPALNEGEILDGVQAALQEARKVGVTSVQDMDGSDTATRRTLLGILQSLSSSGKLTLRVRLYFPLAAWNSLAQIGVMLGFGDLWVSIGSLKDFIDGSLGSSTAKMFDPYLNEPGSTGLYVTPPGKLRDNVLAADKAGLGIAVHAIGDRGNAELLDIFAEVAKKNGPRDRRLRVEHAQHLRPQDIKRFAELGVIASMQPYHLIDDGRWAEGRIGAKRCASSYALRSLLDAGAKVALGSDWSVAPIDPLLGIDAAVNRRTLDGRHPGGWFPEQKITVKEAIEGYTLTSAYAAFQEKNLGTLEVGKLADLVVLSRDILADAERDHIAETTVVLTMVGGKVVYERK